MTLKRVKNYDLFATGDACIFSMAGEPEYMYENITPSKHYNGYIKHVNTQYNEFTVVITDDTGKPRSITHFADPVRTPIGIPLYFLMEVLMDHATYKDRLQSREKKDLKYVEKVAQETREKAVKRRTDGEAEWSGLKDY